jgi:hypothetical protein
MRQRPNLHRLAKSVAVIGLVPVAGLFVGGCGTPSDLADAEVEKLLAAASKANAEGRLPALEKAEKVADVSPETKVHVQTILGDAELAVARADQAEADAHATTVRQLAVALSRMAGNVTTSTDAVANLNKLEPTAAKQGVDAKLKELNEGTDGVWVASSAPLASLTTSKATVADLEKKIADAETKLTGLTDAQSAVTNEAESLNSKSVAAKGRESVDLYKQASGKRKEAADLASQADVVRASLVPLRQDLGIAQAQVELRTAAVASFEERAKATDAGWTNLKAASEGVAAVARDIVIGDDKGAGSVVATVAKLKEAVTAQKDAVDQAVRHFENAINHYDIALTESRKLATDYGRLASEKPDSKVVPALKDLQNTFFPSAYELKKGTAQAGFALLLSRVAESSVARSNAVAEVMTALGKAQIAPPDGLVEAGNADAAKADVGKASEAFDAAVVTLTNVTTGNTANTPAGNDARDRAKASLMLTEYNWGQFAAAVGDAGAAKQHISNAVQQRAEVADLVVNQNRFRMPALPAELAIQAAPVAPTTPATPVAPGAPAAPAAPATPGT